MSTPDLDATFAFVDLAGFTAVTEAHGDHQAIAIIQAFRARTREVLGRDDEIVKTIGDAVMLRFPTPDDAVVALQELIQREISTPDAVLLPRAGAHHGSAVAIDGDYYGAAVNLAARVAGQAKAGQLLVTSRVASAAQQLGSVVRHLGTPGLRNVADPVDLYEVRVDVETIETATDLVCQMRVPIAAAHAINLEWSGRHYHFCGLPCVARFAAAPDTFLARAISDPTPLFGDRPPRSPTDPAPSRWARSDRTCPPRSFDPAKDQANLLCNGCISHAQCSVYRRRWRAKAMSSCPASAWSWRALGRRVITRARAVDGVAHPPPNPHAADARAAGLVDRDACGVQLRCRSSQDVIGMRFLIGRTNRASGDRPRQLHPGHSVVLDHESGELAVDDGRRVRFCGSDVWRPATILATWWLRLLLRPSFSDAAQS